MLKLSEQNTIDCLPIPTLDALVDHIPFFRENPWAFGLFALFGAVAVLFAINWYLKRFFHRRIPQLATARIATPAEIDLLEQSIGGKLPALLRNAYQDGTINRLVLPAKINIEKAEEVIAEFFAADAQANRKFVDFWGGFPASAFVFVGDDFGNYYFVQAGTDAVYFWDHDSSTDVSIIFHSFEDFWQLLTQTNKTPQV